MTELLATDRTRNIGQTRGGWDTNVTIIIYQAQKGPYDVRRLAG